MAKRTGARGSAAKSGEIGAPDAGDLVWLNFTPQAGREQAGRRPALVLSPRAYNSKVGLCLVCPVTQHPKGYPFEVLLPGKLAVTGVVLADHLRSADWRERQCARIGALAPSVMDEVRSKLRPLLGM
jgi:mRNA interferase MazF